MEVQAVSPPNRRSWFLADEVVGGTISLLLNTPRLFMTVTDGKLLVMTPMDPAFILIRMLHTTQMVCICNIFVIAAYLKPVVNDSLPVKGHSNLSTTFSKKWPIN